MKLTWQRSMILAPATHWETSPVNARFTILDASWYLVITSLERKRKFRKEFKLLEPHPKALTYLPVGKIGGFFGLVAVYTSVVAHVLMYVLRMCILRSWWWMMGAPCSVCLQLSYPKPFILEASRWKGTRGAHFLTHNLLSFVVGGKKRGEIFFIVLFPSSSLSLFMS